MSSDSVNPNAKSVPFKLVLLGESSVGTLVVIFHKYLVIIICGKQVNHPSFSDL